MVKLVALLRRREGLTQEEFNEWWIKRHAPIARQLPGLRGYRINLVFGGPEEERPYDGTAELWFDGVEAMEAAFAAPVGQEAGRDADEHTSVRIHLYTDEHVIM